jgi:hypothetical protein
MNNNTPGPWQVKRETDYAPAQVWADGRQLAEVYGESRDARKANSQLMAAAPELLESLREALPLLYWANIHGSRCDEVIARALEAFQKAGVSHL